jgi:hypothetical protein
LQSDHPASEYQGFLIGKEINIDQTCNEDGDDALQIVSEYFKDYMKTMPQSSGECWLEKGLASVLMHRNSHEDTEFGSF